MNRKVKKINRMFFLVIVVGAALALLIWNLFVDNIADLDVKIPESKNIVFNDYAPIPMTTTQVANQFENWDDKPILLYLYTTWCKICAKNLPAINELAREFQNTDLKIIALAIDRDQVPEQLSAYLNQFGNLYFPPHYLAFKDGFLEFLQKRDIPYNGRIPFTVLISSQGEVVTKFVGIKSKNYLRNKIIRELFS